MGGGSAFHGGLSTAKVLAEYLGYDPSASRMSGYTVHPPTPHQEARPLP